MENLLDVLVPLGSVYGQTSGVGSGVITLHLPPLSGFLIDDSHCRKFEGIWLKSHVARYPLSISCWYRKSGTKATRLVPGFPL